MPETPVDLKTLARTPTPCGWPDLCCPKCGNVTILRLRIDQLDADDAIKCDDCDEECSIDHIRAVVSGWAPVLAWIDSANQFCK